VNNKEELLAMLKNNSQVQIQQLQEQLQQAQMVMQQMNDQYQRTQKDMQNIDTIIAENERLKSMMAELTAKIYEQDSNQAQRNMEITRDMQTLLQMMRQNQGN
jgi:RecG-like helicase